MKRIIIICVLISLIPIGIIGGGAYWAFKRNSRFERYKNVKGEIIALDKKKKDKYDASSNVVYYPKIRYYDENNEVHVFEPKVGSNPPIGRLYERVDLLINPENPENVVIDSFFYKWFGPTVVLIIGFIILTFVIIVSVGVILNERKRHYKT
ncbi:MAG: DUF3592 domain-containing protein [Pseudomonadota bacterium]